MPFEQIKGDGFCARILQGYDRMKKLHTEDDLRSNTDDPPPQSR
jgi:hypothetical protein